VRVDFHRRAPKVTLAQVPDLHVARVGTPEVHHDLVAVVGENPPLLSVAVAIGIEPLVHPAIGVVVGVLDHLVYRRRVVGPVLDFDQPVAVVPGVLGNAVSPASSSPLWLASTNPCVRLPSASYWHLADQLRPRLTRTSDVSRELPILPAASGCPLVPHVSTAKYLP